MNRKTFVLVLLGLGLVAGGLVYFRHNHPARTFAVRASLNDPVGATPSGAGRVGSPTTGLPAGGPVPPANHVRSPEVDRSLKTVQDVNAINRLNQAQNPPSTKKP